MKPTDRSLLTVLGVLVLVALLGGLLGGGMMGPGMMWGYDGTTHMNGWSWGLGMAFAWIAMLAILGAVVLGGILLARLGRRSPAHGRRDAC